MADYSNMNDADLLSAYYGGDDLAFAELHRRYLAALSAYAYRILRRIAGRAEKAEELALDAFVKVALTRGRGSAWDASRGIVTVWLFAIIRNLALSYLRLRHGRACTFTDLPINGIEQDEARLESLLAADDAGPLEELLQQELEEALSVCVDQLPEQEHQVVSLLMRGLQQTEIARILEVADSTVRLWRLKAYEHLLECLRQKNLTD